MQLDDFQNAWAQHGAVLDRTLRINERLLREVIVRKVRFALLPYVLARVLGIVGGLATSILLVSVLLAHTGEVRYVLLGSVSAAFVICMTVMSAYLLARVSAIDYSEPVTSLRREVESIKIVEYRAFKWALLGGTVLWVPIGLLLFEAAVGVAALARVHQQDHVLWIAGNVIFGMLLLALGHALSKKFVERADLGPRARRWVDALSGRQLQRVSKSLAELSDFEREAS